jgi:TolB-like protein/AraC-like DNA-binding protein
MILDYQSLITRLEQLIEENIGNEEFGVEELASAAGISRSHLHRKLRATRGQSASQFIREYRLNKALILLKEEQQTVSEVAFWVGFSSATYFSKCFADLYGHPPSQANKINIPDPNIDPKQPSGRKWVLVLFALAILLHYSIFFIIQMSRKGKLIEEEASSVAIMPFQNLSDDSVNAYFSVGVGDAIARKLSGISYLRVVSKTGPVQKGSDLESIVEIAHKLNTSHVLEGSVQRFGEMIRVEVGLVSGKTGHRIWAEHYDRKFEDIFQVQNEIAEKVVLSLKTSLSPTERSELNLGYTNDPQAYELYMKARFEYSTYSREGIGRAEVYLDQAIALDPDFALAHSLLGNIFFAKGSMFGAELDARVALKQAFIHISKALEIEPDLPEAHTMKGFYHLYFDWDFKKAEEEYILGVERFSMEGYAMYADYLNFVGKHTEALEISMELERYEPYYPNSRMILSLFYNQMFNEAKEFALARLRIMQNYSTLDSYGFLLLNTGEYKEAIDIFSQIFEIENVRYPRILGWMGAAYARSGQEIQARILLEELKELRLKSTAGSPGFFIAVIYAALGENEKAQGWITTAMNDHEMEIPWLTTEPQFYALHNQTDFKDLVKKVGFPGF